MEAQPEAGDKFVHPRLSRVFYSNSTRYLFLLNLSNK